MSDEQTGVLGRVELPVFQGGTRRRECRRGFLLHRRRYAFFVVEKVTKAGHFMVEPVVLPALYIF